MKRVLTVIGLMLLVVMVGTSPAAGKKQIIIGGVAPLAAPGAAESGAEMKAAMEMAVQEIAVLVPHGSR